MWLLIFLILAATIALLFRLFKSQEQQEQNNNVTPVSVNFHFTRKCNYECGFCFHTAKTSYVTPLEEAKRGLSMVKEAGMKKINFSGGEPFLYPKYLGELVKYCKKDLKLESVSIISNGSKIKQSWFDTYAEYLDILAISVDSFDENTNVKIGRGKGKHLEQLTNIRDWCELYRIKFKLNSVICTYNWKEDMVDEILNLRPFRWKVFQCLLVDTENAGESAIRIAKDFIITDEQYEHFCSKHRHLKCFVPESNALMKESYIILDEYMRFLNKGDVYAESDSILTVGVHRAIQQIDFDVNAFNSRGGVYDWTKMEHLLPISGSCSTPASIDW